MNWLTDNLTTIICSFVSGIIGLFAGMKIQKQKTTQNFSQKAGNSSNQNQSGGPMTINK